MSTPAANVQEFLSRKLEYLRKALKVVEPKGDWKMIFEELYAYSERNKNNPHTSIFSHQALLIAQKAYLGRKQFGGWSGDFTESVFLTVAHSIRAQRGWWDNPPGSNRHGFYQHGSMADYLDGGVFLGELHFKKHLQPGFNKFIKRKMVEIFSKSSKDKVAEDMTDFIQNLIVEHENFIKHAVKPSFDEVRDMARIGIGEFPGGIHRWFAKETVTNDVRKLRLRTIVKVVRELEKLGLDPVATKTVLANTLKITTGNRL